MNFIRIDRTFINLREVESIEVEDLTKHKTDSEEMEITQEACDIINTAKNERNKIFAVGTTTLKALETCVNIKGQVNPFKGWTNKFIFHPYQFTAADAFVSNFHLPYSTQLMMVAAFGGYDIVMNAYKVAKEEGYRFGTYGDAMLIL